MVGEIARCTRGGVAGNEYASYVANLVLLLAVPSLPRGIVAAVAAAADSVPTPAALLAVRDASVSADAEAEAEHAWECALPPNAKWYRVRFIQR